MSKILRHFDSVLSSADAEDARSILTDRLLANDMYPLRAYREGRGMRFSTWIGLLSKNVAYDLLRVRAQQIRLSRSMASVERAVQRDAGELAGRQRGSPSGRRAAQSAVRARPDFCAPLLSRAALAQRSGERDVDHAEHGVQQEAQAPRTAAECFEGRAEAESEGERARRPSIATTWSRTRTLIHARGPRKRCAVGSGAASVQRLSRAGERGRPPGRLAAHPTSRNGRNANARAS